MKRQISEHGGEKVLVSRREWLRLTALAGASAGAFGAADFSFGSCGNNFNRSSENSAALWLMVTTGKNYDSKSDKFTWDKDAHGNSIEDLGLTSDTLCVVRDTVDKNPGAFIAVQGAWVTVRGVFKYAKPDPPHKSIVALAKMGG